MSYRSDTQRCPYCRGNMLITEHVSSGSKEKICGACGTHEIFDFTGEKPVHKLARPAAFVELVFPYGIQDFPYYGPHPYKWLNDWKHSVPKMVDINLAESFGVVYNKKHKKLETVFGPKPTIYPDEYYEDDQSFY